MTNLCACLGDRRPSALDQRLARTLRGLVQVESVDSTRSVASRSLRTSPLAHEAIIIDVELLEIIAPELEQAKRAAPVAE